MRCMSRTSPEPRAGGFALPTAVFLLVILAALGAFMLGLSQLGSRAQDQDLLGERAYQAARAGIEWGAYQSLRNGTCAGTTLAFSGTSMQDMSTSVSCTRVVADELGTAVDVDQITATACNAAPCPNPAPADGYVERQLTIVVAR